MDRDLADPGQRVEWAITHSKRTAKDIAAEMGVSHAVLSQWKRGHTKLHNAKVCHVLKFCQVTGIRIDWLLTGDGERLAQPRRSDEPELVTQARHIVHDLSPELAATAYRLLAALEGSRKSSP